MNTPFSKNHFSAFLKRTHTHRHYRRYALFGKVMRSGLAKTKFPQNAVSLLDASKLSPSEILNDLNTSMSGLKLNQVNSLRTEFGLNEVEREKPLTWWAHLWQCYSNPFNILLTILASISYWTQDVKATVVIMTMVVISTGLRFIEQTKSNKAAEALKAMVSNTIGVLRTKFDTQGPTPQNFQVNITNTIEIPIVELVPGDIIVLSAGDMIPADCRIIYAKDLFVSQSAMTGESMPVEKFVENKGDTKNPLELDNIVFMGTNVVSGSATAVVVMTGPNTYFGELAKHIVDVGRPMTSFELGVNKVSWLLIRFMFVMVPLVFFINGFSKGDWLEALLFALSVAVGLTPEMLPMIVTTTLAKGAIILSRQKVVVKRLDAIQNFGAMDVLCTDKTGTLTQDKIIMAHHVNIYGEDSEEVLRMAYLNSYYQTGLRNLLDVAVLAEQQVHQNLDPGNNYSKVDEIPFDFNRRRMSVVVSHLDQMHLLICKGAIEEVIAACTFVREGDVDKPISESTLSGIKELTGRLNSDGLRVVAVATKSLSVDKLTFNVSDESQLTLVGFVAFLDPPKESTLPALDALAAHGISVKVLTGDNELVTLKVCREVGLAEQGFLLGSEIEAMSEKELSLAVEKHNIFAKLSPTQKERVVSILRANGHVVGYMGDGINDAPALRIADIGISVDSGVDVAKEAADIILLEKSLMVLDRGVIEGRRTFSNMLKYIKMTASSNFGNVLSVLVASALLPFLPMLPMHLLIQNLFYDISQVSIPFDNVDSELLIKPEHWNAKDIGRFMICFGPISSVFDIATYFMMWFVFHANTPEHQTLFQSGWFIVGIMTQTLIIHMIRTPKIPFIQSRAATSVTLLTSAVLMAALFLPMGPLGPYFKLQPLPLIYFAYLAAILVGYMLLTQIVKVFYVRRWGWQ